MSATREKGTEVKGVFERLKNACRILPDAFREVALRVRLSFVKPYKQPKQLAEVAERTDTTETIKKIAKLIDKLHKKTKRNKKLTYSKAKTQAKNWRKWRW